MTEDRNGAIFLHDYAKKVDDSDSDEEELLSESNSDSSEDLDQGLANYDESTGDVLVQYCSSDTENIIYCSFPALDSLGGKINEVTVESSEPINAVANEINHLSKSVTGELDGGFCKSIENKRIIIFDEGQVYVQENDGNLIDEESIDDPARDVAVDQRVLACWFCDDTFTSESSLSRHHSKKHKKLKEMLKVGNTKIKCKQCDEFVMYSKMHDHMASHLPEDNKCPYCKLLFRSLKRLRKHVNTHKNSEQSCHYCGLQFTNNRNKMIHITKMHKELSSQETMEYLCDVCGVQFHYLQKLSIHRKEVHFKTAELHGSEFSNAGNKLGHLTLHSKDSQVDLCKDSGHQPLHENHSDVACETCSKSSQIELEYDVPFHEEEEEDQDAVCGGQKLHENQNDVACKTCSKSSQIELEYDVPFHEEEEDEDAVCVNQKLHENQSDVACETCSESFQTELEYDVPFHEEKEEDQDAVCGNQKLHENQCDVACETCSKSSQIELEYDVPFHEEEKEEDQRKPHICEVCSKQFHEKRFLRKHMVCHSDSRPYLCFCGASFKRRLNLQRHTKKQHEIPDNEHISDGDEQILSDTTPHQVPQSEEISNNEQILSNNSDYTKQRQDALHSEQISDDEQFSSNSTPNLKTHQVSSKKTKLPEASYSKQNSDDVKQITDDERVSSNNTPNVKTHQVSSKKTKLPEASYSKQNSDDVKQITDDERVSSNNTPNVKTHQVSSKETKLHEASHSKQNSDDEKQISPNKRQPLVGDTKFVCSICKRVLKTELKLRWHVAQHKGEKKPFECEQCGRCFSKLIYYKTHLLKHTGERPFRCSDCKQAFRSRSTLQEHIKHLHLKIYSCRCNQCGQLFKHRNTLISHRMVHTGEKPYSCHMCDRKFMQNGSLSKHLKSKHEVTDSTDSNIEVEPTIDDILTFTVSDNESMKT